MKKRNFFSHINGLHGRKPGNDPTPPKRHVTVYPNTRSEADDRAADVWRFIRGEETPIIK